MPEKYRDQVFTDDTIAGMSYFVQERAEILGLNVYEQVNNQLTIDRKDTGEILVNCIHIVGAYYWIQGYKKGLDQK